MNQKPDLDARLTGLLLGTAVGDVLVAIIERLIDEEKLLCQELPGYEVYCRKVQYTLIPYVL
jgi:protein-S-isoprenylcysteine O-methyltransferase Ste14